MNVRIETAEQNDGWDKDKPTVPEPLAVRLGGVGEDADLLEGYVGVRGGDGATLIASTDDGESVMRLDRTQVRALAGWLREVDNEQERVARMDREHARMKEMGL